MVRVITKRVKFAVFFSKIKLDSDDALENLNTEVCFIGIVRNLLLRFGESNLEYVQTRVIEILSKLINLFREKDQRVHKMKSFVLPKSMKHLPYYVFCFIRSELLNQKIVRKLTHIETIRRKLMSCSPLNFLLEIAPVVYNLSYYNTSEPSDNFIIPPSQALLSLSADQQCNFG